MSKIMMEATIGTIGGTMRRLFLVGCGQLILEHWASE